MRIYRRHPIGAGAASVSSDTRAAVFASSLPLSAFRDMMCGVSLEERHDIDNVDKVTCRTPTPGKQPTRIDRWKYDVLRKAILDVLGSAGEGVRFKDLPKLVRGELTKQELADLGSLSWFVTTVKLELELAGEIERLSGSSPQVLRRVDAERK